MITYEQAVRFLEWHLRMPLGWKELLHSNPLEFLALYMRRHAVRIPFQNIEMVSVDEEKRWIPSETDLVNVGLAGRGGCCIHLNYFSKLVLQEIGLESFVGRGDLYSAMTAGTHCLLFVKLYSPAEQTGTYMVEVGDAYPLLEPICMDKEKLPYRTLQAAGFPYEYREFAPGWIGKFHLKGGLLGGAYSDNTEEKMRTSWDLKPRALWEFDYPMLETFTNPAASGILKNPVMYRYFTNAEFRRLFPELPENVKLQKDKIFVTDKPSRDPLANGGVGKFPPKKKCAIKIKDKEDFALNGISNENSAPVANGKQNGELPASKMASDVIKPPRQKEMSSTKFGEPVVCEGEFEKYKAAQENGAYFDDDDDLEPPENFIVVLKRRIVVGDAHSRKVVKNFSSYEEMAPELKRYFPNVPPSAIDKAMVYFNGFEPIPSAHDRIL